MQQATTTDQGPGKKDPSPPGFLERMFHLRKNQTSVRRELSGGLTTFMTMAYIIFVLPVVAIFALLFLLRYAFLAF